MAKWYQEAVSFGAVGRVERSVADYRSVLRQAQRLARGLETRCTKTNIVLEELASVKKACLPVLARVQRIARNLGTKSRQFMVEPPGKDPPALSFARIQESLDAASEVRR